jgi:hypothetical protein
MPTITFTVDTPIATDAFRSALLDFTPNRPNLWKNLDPKLYKVHEVGDTWADVTEGASIAGGVWERSRYDWSQPGVVKTTLIDSNSFAPGSYWQYRIDKGANGGSRIEVTVHRLGRGLKGRFVVTLIGLVGKRVLRKDFDNTLSQIRARSA